MKTCPRCGSASIEAAGFDGFTCGTFQTTQGPRFTKNCRLIWETGNRFKAEVERLNAELAKERAECEAVSLNRYNWQKCAELFKERNFFEAVKLYNQLTEGKQ